MYCSVLERFDPDPQALINELGPRSEIGLLNNGLRVARPKAQVPRRKARAQARGTQWRTGVALELEGPGQRR